jgi:hypothetical protein
MSDWETGLFSVYASHGKESRGQTATLIDRENEQQATHATTATL